MYTAQMHVGHGMYTAQMHVGYRHVYCANACRANACRDRNDAEPAVYDIRYDIHTIPQSYYSTAPTVVFIV
jgi:hypothetical protein